MMRIFNQHPDSKVRGEGGSTATLVHAAHTCACCTTGDDLCLRAQARVSAPRSQVAECCMHR